MWDPSVLDFDLEEADEQWFDALEHHEQHPHSQLFDEFGNCCHHIVAELHQVVLRVVGEPTNPVEHALDCAVFHAHLA